MGKNKQKWSNESCEISLPLNHLFANSLAFACILPKIGQTLTHQNHKSKHYNSLSPHQLTSPPLKMSKQRPVYEKGNYTQFFHRVRNLLRTGKKCNISTEKISQKHRTSPTAIKSPRFSWHSSSNRMITHCPSSILFTGAAEQRTWSRPQRRGGHKRNFRGQNYDSHRRRR